MTSDPVITTTTATAPESSSNSQESEKEIEYKDFTVHRIPSDVHRFWKMLCFSMDMTMDQFALEALKEKMTREVEKQKKAQEEKAKKNG